MGLTECSVPIYSGAYIIAVNGFTRNGCPMLRVASLDAQIDALFSFMVNRENVRLRKEAREPWPWSDDWILNKYKFTNVKREHDRTTRWMRQNWTEPNADRPPGEILFNCALFRYFGNIEFASAIGWQQRWDAETVIRVAQDRRSKHQRVFTGAYIIPTLGKRLPKHEVVCTHILGPLWANRNKIAHVAVNTKSWKQTASELRENPGFGGSGFMAKETLQDLMHTPVLADAIDRNTWCPAGPGARRGLNRIFGRDLNATLAEMRCVNEMVNLFELAQNYMPDFMPELELHDIQFQLCEFDKYERARLNQGRPKSVYRPPSFN